MLQSYQVLYDHGHLIWQTDKPSLEEARVIVTLLPAEETPTLKAKRQPSRRITGQCKILGDIIAPVAPIEDWEDLV